MLKLKINAGLLLRRLGTSKLDGEHSRLFEQTLRSLRMHEESKVLVRRYVCILRFIRAHSKSFVEDKNKHSSLDDLLGRSRSMRALIASFLDEN